MKNEKFYEAMENINDELILGAAEEPKRKTHPIGKIKWTVLAAAITLLIAVPVVALTFELTVNRHESGYWDVYNEDARFALDEFSPELLERAEEIDNPEGIEIYPFIGKTRTEEFLGIKLPDNPALRISALRMLHRVDEEGKTIASGNYRVVLGKGQIDKLIRVSVMTMYWFPGGRTEYIDYDFITEEMPFENAGHSWEEDGRFHSSEEPETYVTENGRKCVLVKQEHKGPEFSTEKYGYLGFVMIDRINIRVDIRCASYDEARERVIEILENFE